MSLRRVMLKYLGWCPTKDAAETFQQKVSPLNLQVNSIHILRVLVFTLFSAKGLELLRRIYQYWFIANRVQQITGFPSAVMIFDIFYVLIGIVLIAFAVDFLVTKRILARHTQMLGIMLLSFGLGKGYMLIDNFLPLFVPLSHLPAFIIARAGDIVSHTDALASIYLASLIFRRRPLFNVQTFKALSLYSASIAVNKTGHIVRQLLSNTLVIDSALLRTCLVIVLESLITYGFYRMNRDRWSKDRLLTLGIPKEFRFAAFIYGIYVVTPIVVLFLTPNYIRDVISNSQVGSIFVIVSFTLVAISVMFLSLIKWDLNILHQGIEGALDES